jgi:hypothetical protein
MAWWKLVVGMAVAGAACGGSTASDPLDAAVHTAPALVDAHPSEVGSPGDGATAADGPGAEASAGAPTWTAIYGQLLVNAGYPSNCLGSGCHDPGVEKGIDLSTREKGWSTIMKRVTAGKPESSDLVTVLKSGYMPQGRPEMPAADVAQISAWISAGAQDD